MITNRLNKYALMAGWVAGIASGLYLVEVANHFGPLKTSLYPVAHVLIFIGLLSLLINVVVALVFSVPTMMKREQAVKEKA